MKILISHSYFLYFDPKEAANKRPYPPLASLTLASWIKKELNLDIEFYDVMFDKDENGIINFVKEFKPDVFILYDDDFNFLTKMCLENMRDAIFRIMKKIEKQGIFIAHGSDASDQAEKYLRAGFNFVIHRNAEKVIVDLLSEYKNELSINKSLNLPSLSYYNGSEFIHNEEAKINFSLEESPFPLWEKIDLIPYREMWKENHGYFSLNFSSAHGCPYGCNWCAKPLYGRSYKAISASKAANHFSFLMNELGADHIWITDDIFALKPGWITEFADELEKLKIRIPYKCLSRPDLITENFAAELKRSGCEEVWLGAESGSQKILDAMEKGLFVNYTLIANSLLKKYKIKTGLFIQYGYPGEDIDDIKKTLKMIRNCLPDYIGVSVSYPLKGTPFYNQVVSIMGEKKNWNDSGDLALMFHGKFSPDFYRALHQFTHHYFGIISILKTQSFKKRLRRIFSVYKHLPGLIQQEINMKRQISKSKFSLVQ